MNIDFTLLTPEFLLTALGFLVLGVGLTVNRSQRNTVTAAVSLAGLLSIGIFSVIFLWDKETSLYGGIYRIDHYALLFKAIFMSIGFITVMMSVEYVGKRMHHPGEFYSLIVFSVLGSSMLAASGELLTAFISLELLSFSLYVLVSLPRGDHRSAEAGTKYILLGALSTAIMLYGISILYGTLGTTMFSTIGSVLGFSIQSPSVIIGMAMLLAGLGFKLAAVPFHMWAPDVYEGSPTPVTGYLSVLSKAAGFALVLRFFSESLLTSIDQWQLTVAVIAAATMTVGNLTALAQINIKRLLAYSSIGQVGFLMVGLVALSPNASTALILHLVGYAFTNLTVFMVVIFVENQTGGEEVPDFSGLANRSPFSALAMTAALFSLAGLPIFAGFITKFYLFTAASEQGFLWLAAVAITNSLVSLYYYLRIIRQMYVEEPSDSSPLKLSILTTAVLVSMLTGTIMVGILPAPFVSLIEAGTESLGLITGN